MPRLRARLAPLATLLAASTAVALAACGGDGGGGTGTSGSADGDRDAAADAVTGYAKAFAAGDAAKACGYLSAGAQKEIEAAGEQLGKSGCAAVLAVAATSLSADDKKVVDTLRVTAVKVDGDSATVETRLDGAEDGDTDPTRLVREDGAWKIAPEPQERAKTPTVTAATVTVPTTP